jgi:hypothetical protein
MSDLHAIKIPADCHIYREGNLADKTTDIRSGIKRSSINTVILNPHVPEFERRERNVRQEPNQVPADR